MPRPALPAALLSALLAGILAPGAAAAQAAEPAVAGAPAAQAEARRVHEALLLPRLIEVMAREGLANGEAMAAGVFGPGPVPAEWDALVAALYDPAKMEAAVLGRLAEELRGQDVAAMAAFFEGEPGRRLVALELAAREAMLEDDVEQAAKEAAAVAMAAEDPRLGLLRGVIEAGDLIEASVASAMNANLAYFTALLDGGALGDGTTEADLTADVWSQEAQIRAETTEWVYAFLLKAYAPASDADIAALTAFTESAEGRALTRALNRAFDQIYADISRSLGLAAAYYMTTERI